MRQYRVGCVASVGGVKNSGSRLSKQNGSCQLRCVTPFLAPAEGVKGDIPLLWPAVMF